MNAKPVGAIAAMTKSLLDLIARFVSLLAEESRVIGLDLAWMFGLVISAAWLAITGWLFALAGLAFTLVQNGIIGWVGALALGAFGSFAGVAILIVVIVRWRRPPVFPATRRQLTSLAEGTDEVSSLSSPLGYAEQQVVEARTAVADEYHLAQASLQHRVESPVLLGGVFLGAIAVGYLSTKYGKSRGLLGRGVLTASQVLLPLWLAIKVAPKSAEK
jgi:hypothetical protein